MDEEYRIDDVIRSLEFMKNLHGNLKVQFSFNGVKTDLHRKNLWTLHPCKPAAPLSSENFLYIGIYDHANTNRNDDR